MVFNITAVRQQFPSLYLALNGQERIFLDNPAGTQVPQRVIDAVTDYYLTKNANQGGLFATSIANDAMVYEARELMADLLNAPSPDDIVFGANMTTLNFALSRAIAQTLPDDAEIVLTRMDHDANVAPWLAIARDRNLNVRWVDINTEDGTLDMDSLEGAINEKTKIVAAVHASNALGTINPVQQIAAMAHAVGAYFVMDAVQSTPHISIDVQSIGCDFLLCSAYKFFGPHVGILWGRRELLESLPAYKVRPSKDKAPYRWETGTPSFETIAATGAAVRYFESLAGEQSAPSTRRQRLEQAFSELQAYETQLADHLIRGLQALHGVHIVGLTDSARLHQRVATVSFVMEQHSPEAIEAYLAKQGIQVWSGNYYAVEAMERLGYGESGMVRVGPVHYNTIAELDTLLNALDKLT